MFPLKIKIMWQWLRLAIFWCLPKKIQDQMNRQTVLKEAAVAMQKTQHSLNIDGEIVEVERRFLFLRMEGIYIFIDINPVFNLDDPHLPCAIETDDLAAYKVAHKMLSLMATELRVRLHIPDMEAFRAQNALMPPRVANALDGKGVFWNCCGCYCLQDTEDEDYNWEGEFPRDNGFCNFHQALLSGVLFEPNCQKGKEIIAAIIKHYPLRPANQGAKSIF